ncbi:MAG TPA: RNA polymerase sigma-70 factor [Candidatus Binataceae bacterium]|nr:RNA polymerase sigma-70 factor [Candidatus Binataceae bacterium]
MRRLAFGYAAERESMNDNNPLELPRLTPAAADSEARLQVFNQHRPLLFSIAYRMLGSVADAEDMVQEAFIRWQQSADTDVQVPRTFLVTIVSRLCINHLQSARVRREEYVGQWLPEPLLTAVEGDPSARLRIDESLSMAFLVLLERLNPLERAVFLLREVFDYDYPEVARVLGHNESNCRQILRRARQHVAQIRQRFDPSPQQHEMLARRFLAACSEGDVTGLLALLSNEIVVYADGGGKAAAVPRPIYGPDHVARFVLGALRKFVPQGRVTRVVEINGQAGLVSYFNGRPGSVITFDVEAGRIRNIYIVSNPEKLARLPVLAADDEAQ